MYTQSPEDRKGQCWSPIIEAVSQRVTLVINPRVAAITFCHDCSYLLSLHLAKHCLFHAIALEYAFHCIENESVPKIIINDTNLYFKTAISMLVISNHNSFRVLFDKIAFVHFVWKIYLHLAFEMASQGTSTVPVVSAHFRSLFQNTCTVCPANISRWCYW